MKYFGVVILIALIILVGVLYLTIASAPSAPCVEANRLVNELDRLLQMRLHETFTIAALPSLRAFAASDPAERTQRAVVALAELQAWVTADTAVRETFVVDKQGITILGTGKGWGQDWSARAFISSALAGKPDFSPPARDLNEVSQYYAAPILDNRGEVAGVLVARLAAQELWAPINLATSDNTYAVLLDENAVRLGDGGDLTRNFVALAPLTVEQQTRVVKEQTYGAQLTILRATNFARAAELIRSGNVDALRVEDLNVAAVSAQRLTTKPWMVLIVASAPNFLQNLAQLTLPLLSAILGAVLATLWLSR